jgi:hypothetical protein
MDELYVILMSWAVMLTGHPAPAHMPQVEMVSHSYLTRAACSGRECKVLGWYPPGETIYVDERLDPKDSLFASSIIVHEMVHYLQYQSRDESKPFNCESTIALEREAYQAQRDFLVRYGVYYPVGASMHSVGCELTAR